MKRILVTGAGGSAANNFIDSLRITKEKFYIVGTDIKKYHLELANVDKRYILPPASSSNYIKKLKWLIKLERIEMLHAQPDPEVITIAKNQKLIPAITFLPNEKTIEISQNKFKSFQILTQKGVPAPQSFLIENEKSLRNAIAKIVKNHTFAWIRAIHGAGSRASLPVQNFAQALSWIKYWEEVKNIGFGEFMVSEMLPGKEFAFQSLWNKGDLVTSQARERLEYIFGNLTVSGQTSSPSVAKTISRKDVDDTSINAILAIDPKPHGIFSLDLKEDKLGKPRVTEINAGRFFTTINFYSHAGLNLPLIYVKLAFGEKIKKPPKYNPLPPNLYWVRMVDMGYKLVKNKKWTSH